MQHSCGAVHKLGGKVESVPEAQNGKAQFEEPHLERK